MKNGNEPLITVIVTTYNRRDLLGETIQSILNQTFTNFELIVVDNMSADGTSEYADSIQDERVSYYRSPNHGVIAVNRNYGIRLAKGEFLAFCDDDDLWLPHKLATQMAVLSENDQAVMCYGQAECFIDDKVVKERMSNRVVKTHHYFNLLRGNYMANSSVIIKKSIFDQLGLLNESPDIREDYEMWLRVARNFQITSTEEILIKYRLHVNNVAGNRLKETLRAIATLKSLVKVLKIPYYLYWPNLVIHYLKYLLYKTNIIKT